MEGWIKLHRSSLEHWLYKTKKPKTYREAWEDMLMHVNYEKKKTLIRGQLYDCDRGQALFSLDTWADIFNWSVQMVRTFFNLLEKDKMITTEGLQYTTRLTICNYDTYQDKPTDRQQTEQQAANTPPTDRQQTANRPLTSTKEGKEGKEDKEVKNIKYMAKKQDEGHEFIFEVFRQNYPGVKRGFQIEFEDFKKKHPKTWAEVVMILSDRLQYQINAKAELASQGEFVPGWKHLQTWINNRSWEEEITITNTKPNGTNKSNRKEGCTWDELSGLMQSKLAKTTNQ